METGLATQLFLSSRRSIGLSPETIRWYQGILKFFAQRYETIPGDPSQIEAFIADCKGKDERKHGYYRTLRCFYGFLENRYEVTNPMGLVYAPKRRRKFPPTLTPDDLDQLIAYPHPKKVKGALYFLIDTGARVGEVVGLTIPDLSDTPWGYTARVRGKTGERIVPISNETYNILFAILPFGYSKYRLRRLISMAFRNARVRGSAHTIRHTFGTLWNGDELVLQSIMGHAHLSTTKVYRHLRTEKLSEQHRRFSPLRMLGKRTPNML